MSSLVSYERRHCACCVSWRVIHFQQRMRRAPARPSFTVWARSLACSDRLPLQTVSKNPQRRLLDSPPRRPIASRYIRLRLVPVPTLGRIASILDDAVAHSGEVDEKACRLTFFGAGRLTFRVDTSALHSANGVPLTSRLDATRAPAVPVSILGHAFCPLPPRQPGVSAYAPWMSARTTGARQDPHPVLNFARRDPTRRENGGRRNQRESLSRLCRRVTAVDPADGQERRSQRWPTKR